MTENPLKRRDWVFTLNNYTQDEVNHIQGIDCKYMVYGKEVGANGTPHLQGYVYFKNTRAFNGVKSAFPIRIHLEAARASTEQNIIYCKKGNQSKAEYDLDGVKGANYGKDADIFEKGVKPLTQKEKGDGEVERFEEAKRAAMEGRIEDIPGDIFIRNYRSLCQIKADNMVKPADLDNVCGVWIYGKAGIGKSRMARALYPALFDKLINKWWDGYQNEEAVLLDDFDATHACLFHHLKRWADRYSFTCEKKGGAMCIRPKVIIVTSQYRFEEIWQDEKTVAAISRRFKFVELTEPYVEGYVPEVLNQPLANYVVPQLQYADVFNPPTVLGARTAEQAGLDDFDFDDALRVLDDLDFLL